MKRYRITIEELPGEASPADATTATSSAGRLEDITSGAGQGEGEEEETAVKKVATTTAMMPTGVVDWLLNVSYDKPYGFRLPAAEETEKKKEWDSRNESGDESTEAIAEVAVSAVATGDVGIEDVVPQVPLPEQEASSSTVIAVLAVPSQQAPPTPESAPVAIAATEPAVATKIEALSVPVAAVATVVAASNTKANADAPVNAKPTEAALSSTSPSSSVLVNKVMEVRPSWDRQDQTAATSINNAHQDSSRTRQWPPRRRHSESFTQTTITHPDGTTESKTVTFNRHTGVTETHTRIQRPDGSFIESSTHRTNPSHVSSPSQGQEVSRQQQVQQTPQTQCKGGNPYRNHLNRVAAQQQQQGQQGQGQQAAETIASAPLAPAPTVAVATPTHAPTPTPSHRPSFKERWNQRRQEHREFLEELRAEREHEREQHTSAHTHATKDQQQQQHKEQQQSERGRRERRQELRDAEARQREAIAAAYGFVPTSPPPSSTPSPPSSASASSSTSSTSSNWSRFDRDHDQDRDHGRRHHRKRHEEEDNYDNERSRSWPPKGYLKRQEREREQQQEQPRHNV
ncbi:hypothetical protein BGW39_002322 [Mortierella sp. 14UC]|nr:hypothetical protein BGW39_002322 [Mortierella sp. 14UC]